ncbi:hypothetical protein MMC18_009646 [Xylographa bjoerkii]|nr:hypothetical protein [Xylographa bjoerkii]
MACGKDDIPPALGPSKEWSGIIQNYDLIETIDMAGPPPKEPFNPFQGPAPDLDCTKKDAEDISNGLNTRRIYGRSGVKEDDDLPTIEELLFGARNAQEWQQIGSSDRQVTGGSEGNLEDAQQEGDGSIDVQSYNKLTPDKEDKEREAVRPDKSIGTHDHDTHTNGIIALRNKPKSVFRFPPSLEPNDWDDSANSYRKEPGSPANPIVVQDQDIDSSGDGASEEQNGNQGSLSTPSTSVAGSEAGYSTLDQKNKHDTPNTSPSNGNTISLTPDKRTCGLKGGNREGLTSDPSTDGENKIPWNDQEAEADDKKEDGEEYTGNGRKETTPLLELTKKRGPSAVEGQFALKRQVKRRRRSSPILAVQDQNYDTQVDGSSPESKSVKTKVCHATIAPSPASDVATSPPALEQTWEHGDEAQVEELEWEIEKILNKRETISGTEYKVRWKSTWLLKDKLDNARKLLREFEAQRQAQHGHKRGRPARVYKV